jgi:hypothetical protein
LRSTLFILGALILIAAVLAIVQRDKIADLILRGGDVSLSGETAQNSPQARIALDFLAALRAGDKEAIARLATAELVARVAPEAQAQPSADSQSMKEMMLQDVPAEPGALRSHIKSVQTHKAMTVVLFETKSNSWFVQLTKTDGTWKVSGF